MFDWGSAWAQLGAVGLLAVIILSFLTAFFSGRLLPRWWVKLQLDRADAELKRSQLREEQAWQLVDTYRKAVLAADERADLWLSTLQQGLGSTARSVEELARAVPAAIAAPPPPGRGDGS